jgi:hypothetical protein
MLERTKLRQQYNRLGSILVFVANAFTLMYVGSMSPDESLWYGMVSGAFTYTILNSVAEAAEVGEMMREERRSQGLQQQQNPQQQQQQQMLQPPSYMPGPQMSMPMMPSMQPEMPMAPPIQQHEPPMDFMPPMQEQPTERQRDSKGRYVKK